MLVSPDVRDLVNRNSGTDRKENSVIYKRYDFAAICINISTKIYIWSAKKDFFLRTESLTKDFHRKQDEQ